MRHMQKFRRNTFTIGLPLDARDQKSHNHQGLSKEKNKKPKTKMNRRVRKTTNDDPENPEEQ